MTDIAPPVLRRRSHPGLLRFLDGMTYTSALSGSLVLIGLLAILLLVVFNGALPAIKQFGLDFLTTSRWNPVTGNFGAWPFIYSTLLTSVVALLISFPVSLGSAIFLTKLAPKTRIPVPAALLGHKTPTGWTLISPRYLVTTASFLIELLAAIPSIAYGLWGIAVLIPFMQRYVQPFLGTYVQSWSGPLMLRLATWTTLPENLHNYLWNAGIAILILGVVANIGATLLRRTSDKFHRIPYFLAILGIVLLVIVQLQNLFTVASQFFSNPASGFNIFSASVVLAIMVTPIITAIIRDVLAVAPPELEQGALGLGATWWQAMKLVIGYSKMGIFGAVILGFARAMGETMAVTMIIGNSKPDSYSLFASGQTIASELANQFNNADTDAEVSALIYTALILLVITTLINGAARVILLRVTTAKSKRRVAAVAAPQPSGGV